MAQNDIFCFYYCFQFLQSNQVKRTPLDSMNESIIRKLNPLVVSSIQIKIRFLIGLYEQYMKPESPREKPLLIYSERQFLIYITAISYPESSGFLVSGATPGRLWGHRKNSIFLIGCSLTVSIVSPQKSCGNKIRCPQSLPGVAPLTKKPEDSGYEIDITVDFPKSRFLLIYSNQRVLSERKFAIINRARCKWVLSRKFKLINDH